MMRSRWLLLPGFLCAVAAGCAQVKYPKAHAVQVFDEVTTLSYTADLRATHVIKRGDRYWILTEPSADAAFSYDDDAGISVGFINGVGSDSQGGDDDAEGAEDLPLTGRTPAVVLGRELMFRLNEMAFNTGATFEQWSELYKANLEIIKTVAVAEMQNSSHHETVSLSTGVTAAESVKVTDQRTASTAIGAEKPGPDKDPPQTPKKKPDSKEDESSGEDDSNKNTEE